MAVTIKLENETIEFELDYDTTYEKIKEEIKDHLKSDNFTIEEDEPIYDGKVIDVCIKEAACKYCRTLFKALINKHPSCAVFRAKEVRYIGSELMRLILENDYDFILRTHKDYHIYIPMFLETKAYKCLIYMEELDKVKIDISEFLTLNTELIDYLFSFVEYGSGYNFEKPPVIWSIMTDFPKEQVFLNFEKVSKNFRKQDYIYFLHSFSVYNLELAKELLLIIKEKIKITDKEIWDFLINDEHINYLEKVFMDILVVDEYLVAGFFGTHKIHCAIDIINKLGTKIKVNYNLVNYSYLHGKLCVGVDNIKRMFELGMVATPIDGKYIGDSKNGEHESISVDVLNVIASYGYKIADSYVEQMIFDRLASGNLEFIKNYVDSRYVISDKIFRELIDYGFWRAIKVLLLNGHRGYKNWAKDIEIIDLRNSGYFEEYSNPYDYLYPRSYITAKHLKKDFHRFFKKDQDTITKTKVKIVRNEELKLICGCEVYRGCSCGEEDFYKYSCRYYHRNNPYNSINAQCYRRNKSPVRFSWIKKRK